MQRQMVFLPWGKCILLYLALAISGRMKELQCVCAKKKHDQEVINTEVLNQNSVNCINIHDDLLNVFVFCPALSFIPVTDIN